METGTEHEIIPFAPENVMLLFDYICGSYHSGGFTLDELKRMLGEMVFFDDEGRYWTIGVTSGKWYYRDDSGWVESEPAGYLYHAFIPRGDEVDEGPNLDLNNPIVKALLKKM